MISLFPHLLSLAAIFECVVATPTNLGSYVRGLLADGATPSYTSADDRLYYVSWSDNLAQVNHTNGPGGQYSVTWSGEGEHFVGKGQAERLNSKIFNYIGTYEPKGNSYLAVYGQTQQPLVEYYIVESYGSSDPSVGAQLKGSVSCNGGIYNVLQITRISHIGGTKVFQQFWSVRVPKKDTVAISGTVNVACHLNAWERFGMRLGGARGYQILAVGGSSGTGSAVVLVV